MPQYSFGSTSDVEIVLDAEDGAWIALQVLDNSTLFFDKSKETLRLDGMGAAAPNKTQGFQLKAATGIFVTWWEGKLWGRSDTVQGLINSAVVRRVKKCGCSGGGSQPEPGFDEGN